MHVCGNNSIAVPNYHISHGINRLPKGIVGQLGYYATDTSCPVTDGTNDAIYWSAQTAIEGAVRIMEGDNLIYSLCRPPGHHASRGNSNGFCFFNNAAIAAHHLRQKYSCVAIIDIDTHAGQGTQDIFYERGDVLYVSVHVDPSDYPPFFACYPDECGIGNGLGASLNIALDKGSNESTVLESIDHATAMTKAFGAEVLVVSLGFDMATDDPLSELIFSSDGFVGAAERILSLNLPTLFSSRRRLFRALVIKQCGAVFTCRRIKLNNASKTMNFHFYFCKPYLISHDLKVCLQIRYVTTKSRSPIYVYQRIE